MDNPFGVAKEYNPFEDVPIEAMPVARPVYFAAHPPVVLVAATPRERESRESRGRDTRWLELPGAFCVAYFCGPCYTFVHLCCAIAR
jgi:hypothetical protein